MANGRKTSVAFIAISAVILVVASSVGFAYAEDKTIFTAYSSGDGNLNMIEITGDYKFDKYMEEGSFGLDELYDFLADNVTHGERINGVNPVNCSTFMVLDADGSGYLAGRNFDFRYCTPMLVFTHPDGGYASVSTVDARMFGNTGETISEIMSDSRFNAAAYIPMDGINEKGVYVAINSVSKRWV